MLTIDPAVFKAYPGTQMGILAVRGADAGVSPVPSAVSHAVEGIHARYGQLDRAGLKAMQPIKAYADYYRKFGYSYHVLGQLESILSGKRTVNAASGLLTAMFLTELESMILTAGHDLDTLQTPLQLNLSNGEERFQSISGKDVLTVAGDMMVVSGGSVISSILRGPDAASKITAKTTNAVFTLYAPPGVEKGAVTSALNVLQERIRLISPGCETIESNVYSES